MRKLQFGKVFMLVISTLIVIPLAMADQIQLYQQNGYSYSNGGEFTLKIVESSVGPDLNVNWGFYSDSARNIGGYYPSFQTFCLEYTEYFVQGITYNVAISDRAIAGGVSQGGDPISIGTAWLYLQFATGKLSNYDYTSSGRNADAGALQATIWWLEDEGSDPGTSNKFRNLVYTQFNDPKADNNGVYPVAVLNVTTVNPGNFRQDQLVLVPEPSTILLLGAGLIGLGLFGRRRFKKN